MVSGEYGGLVQKLIAQAKKEEVPGVCMSGGRAGVQNELAPIFSANRLRHVVSELQLKLKLN